MNKTAVHAVIMVLTTILAKVLGFCRELSLAFSYGASNVSDAYVVAFTLPTILFSGLGTAMLTSYISVYTDLQQNHPSEEKPFHNQVITMSFLLSMLFVAVFLALRYPIVRLFALGFTGEQLDLAVNLSSIMIASLLFLGIGYIIQGYLQMKGRFFAVGMVSVPLNIAVISTILLAHTNYDLLGWGVVIGYAGEFILVLLVALRNEFSYRPDAAFRNRNIRRFLVMVLPIFLGKAINSINILIDKSIASLLTEGVVSVMNYGNRITGFVTSVFVVSITTALFPQLSRLSAASDTKQLKKTYRSSCGIIGLFVIPIAAGMMMFAKEFVQLLFFRGEFTAYDVQRTGEVVFFYSLGLLFYSLKEVTINVYYARQDAKTPTINSAITILLNIVLNLLLMQKMEHKGLALATALSSLITTVMLLVQLQRKRGHMGYRYLAGTYLKMLLAAGVMAAVTLPFYWWISGLTDSLLLGLLAAVLVAMAVYFVACLLLRVKELGYVVVAIMERLRRKKAAG